MRKVMLAAAVAAALVLAACGGDDSDDAPAVSPPSVTIAAGGGGSGSTTAAAAGSAQGDELACQVDRSISDNGTSVADLFLKMGDPQAVEDAIGDLYAKTDGMAQRMRA